MGCLRCGAATEEHQVFCAGCRDTMQAYPVKPGTVVTIPTRPAVEKRSSVKKEFTDKEYIILLKGMVRWLVTIIAVLAVLLCVAAGLLLQTLDQDVEAADIGRNYITQTQQQP